MGRLKDAILANSTTARLGRFGLGIAGIREIWRGSGKVAEKRCHGGQGQQNGANGRTQGFPVCKEPHPSFRCRMLESRGGTHPEQRPLLCRMETPDRRLENQVQSINKHAE